LQRALQALLSLRRCGLHYLDQNDLLALGECMVRISPVGHERLEFAHNLQMYAGGGEYNVAYALAKYGLKTGWVSSLVDNPLGWFIRNHARAVGMDISEVIWEEYDGVGKKGRVGLNFTEVGTGVRASVTMYDRANSAAMNMQPGTIDWRRIFNQRGVRWFHTGGIFSALSNGCAEIVKEAVKAAHDSGTIVSYDLNFRSKLWSSEEAIAANNEIVPYVDVLIGNEEDFQKALGFEVEGVDESLKKLKVESYKAMVKKVVTTHSNIKAVGTTLREVLSGLLNNWSAILFIDGEFYQSRRFENLEIEDRVGGGDGFCSGLVYSFLNGYDSQAAVDFGASHGALLQSTRGDTSMVTLEEVQRIFRGASARIIR